jgi:hypothetical protein
VKKYKFRARIETGERGGAFIIFPYDVFAEFGTRAAIPVKATFDGVEYAGSIVKHGLPQHILGVPKAIREEIAKEPGDQVDVVISRDETLRTVEVPPELRAVLAKEKLLPFFERLSFSHRKEYCRWISEAKKEETRTRRLAKAVELLKAGIKTPL